MTTINIVLNAQSAMRKLKTTAEAAESAWIAQMRIVRIATCAVTAFSCVGTATIAETMLLSAPTAEKPAASAAWFAGTAACARTARQSVVTVVIIAAIAAHCAEVVRPAKPVPSSAPIAKKFAAAAEPYVRLAGFAKIAAKKTVGWRDVRMVSVLEAQNGIATGVPNMYHMSIPMSMANTITTQAVIGRSVKSVPAVQVQQLRNIALTTRLSFNRQRKPR